MLLLGGRLFLILMMFCLKGKEARKTNSLNPMVQAVTVNVRDGALGGIGKCILFRVDRVGTR